jgi:hypothetical protein
VRCYVIATGIVFAIIFVLHIARVFAEGTWILREPVFILTSLLSLGMAT